MGDRLGRYEVLGRLGAGTQGTVLRCRDPELDRIVAVKSLRRKAAYGRDLDQPRFHEARMMSRIQHPNIVTIYDVGLEDQTPFLVFEFVQGELLCDVLRQRRLSMVEVAELVQGILEGVAEAHRCGVVHRDLKPGNIIVSAEGIAKIMDFGIAQVVHRGGGEGSPSIGTPPYLAPEYIQEGRVSTAMDVFALGAIVYEMVTGQAPFGGDTPEAVLEAVVTCRPRPLDQLAPEVDERFAALVTKALEKDPDARFRDAGDMLEALRAFRSALAEMGDSGGRSGSATIEFLIRRMQRNQDFPALSNAITTLNRLVSSDDEDVAPLARLIIKDYALTSKILKVVNSAHYHRFSGGVGTISRAIIVLGTKAVRSLAASLIFFEHLHDNTQVQRLKDRVAASLFSAVFARRFAEENGADEVEEYLLCAMLHRLGELLVTYYLPDESRDVERLIHQGGMEIRQAQRKVLGTTYEEIGVQVAREWNFPEQTIRSMRSVDPGAGSSGGPAHELQQLMANFSNEVVDALQLDGAAPDARIDAVLDRYRKTLGLGREDFDALLKGGSEEFLAMMKEWGNAGSSVSILGAIERSLGGEGTSTLTEETGQGDEGGSETAREPEKVLANGLQEVTNLLLEAHTLTQVFNVVIEAMYRGMGFERVLLILRNPRDETMVARLGFGPDIQDYMGRFRFPTRYAADVFHAALRENVDIHISDSRGSHVRDRLPGWYQALGVAGSFLIFPVVVNARAVGMIYGDHPDPDGFDLTPSRLDLLKALRNQAAMAVLMSMNTPRS